MNEQQQIGNRLDAQQQSRTSELAVTLNSSEHTDGFATDQTLFEVWTPLATCYCPLGVIDRGLWMCFVCSSSLVFVCVCCKWICDLCCVFVWLCMACVYVCRFFFFFKKPNWVSRSERVQPNLITTQLGFTVYTWLGCFYNPIRSKP